MKSSHHTPTLANDSLVAATVPEQPERLRLQHPGQIEHQQQPAAEIAERVAGRRHPVGLFRLGHARQHRVVEHQRPRDAQVAEDEDHGRPLPAAFGDGGEQEGADDADQREADEQPLAPGGESP